MDREDPTVIFTARLMPPRVVGGLERFSADVLASLRHSCRVVDLAHYGSRRRQWRYLATIGIRVRSRARALAPAVVDGSDASMAAAISSAGLPSVVRVHGRDLVHPNPIYQAYLRRYLPRVTTIVANTDATRGLLDRVGIPPEQATTVHPAALSPPRGFAYEPVPGRLLALGRLVPRKGVVHLVQHVWPLLAEEWPDARLDIVGDGPCRRRLLRALARSPAAERVQFHGKISRFALEGLFSHADCLVMGNRSVPGDWEGFGIVAAEAAVRGVPVVATRVDGLGEAVVHGETGLLVTSGSPEELASAVGLVIARTVLAERDLVRRAANARWGTQRLEKDYAQVVRDTWERHRAGP
jgi:phosphatidyl-myo-inositol dimannoside synthase